MFRGPMFMALFAEHVKSYKKINTFVVFMELMYLRKQYVYIELQK